MTDGRPAAPGPAAPAIAALDGAPDGYALVDAGAGRRLERFGAVVVDRPAPVAGARPSRDPTTWRADARFDRAAGEGGAWAFSGPLPDPWTVALGGLVLELRPAPSGQVGLFPEHLAVAEWTAARVAGAASSALHGAAPGTAPPPAILNLFAHTGLATLVLARAGAAVTHVDASRPTVAWARRNAERNALAGRPIRWIVDDAAAFASREARRGRRYDGVLLDPPSYGHGPGGRPWRLVDDLPALLATAAGLLVARRWFLACTVHATGITGDDVAAMVRDALGARAPSATVEVRELALDRSDGLGLPAGLAVLVDGEGARER